MSFQSSKYDEIGEWPSRALPKQTVDVAIQHIHDRFLSVVAPEQICISGGAKYRTVKKMSLPSLFGPIIFDEALTEPIRSMEVSIIPGFLRSQIFVDLKELENILIQIPVPLDIAQVPVVYFPTDDKTSLSVPALVWTDIYRNYELYNQFSDFMVRCTCHENLICYQLIDAYRSCFADDALTDIAEVRRLYKLLLVCFIAKKSVHEISLSENARDHIFHAAVNPPVNIFDAAENSVTEIIVCKFKDFIKRYYPVPEEESHLFQISCDNIRLVKTKKSSPTKRIGSKDKNKKRDRRRDTPFPHIIAQSLPGVSARILDSRGISFLRRRFTIFPQQNQQDFPKANKSELCHNINYRKSLPFPLIKGNTRASAER